MLELFILLISIVALAAMSKNRMSDKKLARAGDNDIFYNNNYVVSKLDLFCIVIIIIMSLYCGLRTTYNDTGVYCVSFMMLDTDFTGINWSLGENPAFMIYQLAMKFLADDNYR